MRQLAESARLLAVTAINDSGGDPDKIADAKKALDEGDTLLEAGAFKDAVAKYKDAVAKGESA